MSGAKGYAPWPPCCCARCSTFDPTSGDACSPPPKRQARRKTKPFLYVCMHVCIVRSTLSAEYESAGYLVGNPARGQL